MQEKKYFCLSTEKLENKVLAVPQAPLLYDKRKAITNAETRRKKKKANKYLKAEGKVEHC